MSGPAIATNGDEFAVATNVMLTSPPPSHTEFDRFSPRKHQCLPLRLKSTVSPWILYPSMSRFNTSFMSIPRFPTNFLESDTVMCVVQSPIYIKLQRPDLENHIPFRNPPGASRGITPPSQTLRQLVVTVFTIREHNTTSRAMSGC